MTDKKTGPAILALVMAGTLSAPALAQDRSRDGPAPLDPLFACRAVTGEADRLSCYDRAVATLQGAATNREIVVLDQTEVKRTRRSLFGFSIPRIGFLRGSGRDGDDEPEFRELTAPAASVRGLGYGKWRIGVDEAQWDTTEALRRDPRVGQQVKIKRGMMGSFFLSVNDGRPVKAKRVQ